MPHRTGIIIIYPSTTTTIATLSSSKKVWDVGCCFVLISFIPLNANFDNQLRIYVQVLFSHRLCIASHRISLHSFLILARDSLFPSFVSSSPPSFHKFSFKYHFSWRISPHIVYFFTGGSDAVVLLVQHFVSLFFLFLSPTHSLLPPFQ